MNTRRMNRLEELGRVDSEKAFTKKGKRNLKDEKKRIVRELKADGGKVDVFKRTDKRKGGGADTGRLGELRSKLGVIKNKIKRKTERLNRLTSARESLKNKKRLNKKDGGSLKPVDKEKNPGLAKLPTKVRNKMGYMKKGGRVKMKSGGIAKRGMGCEIR